MRSCALFRRSASLLFAFSVACKDAPTEPPRIPAELRALSPTTVAGIVATAVRERPSVLVIDGSGAPMPGAVVTFRVDNGVAGGLIGAGVKTGSDGIATVGEWLMPTTAGVVTLTASVGVLRVKFTGLAVAGPPRRMIKEAGDNQFAAPNTAVASPPAVRVVDEYDNAVSGIPVNFEVTQGGGRITNATVTSNTAGVAQLAAWYLGDYGQQSITASVDGVQSLLFLATATNEPCVFKPDLDPTIRIAGDLSSADCQLSDGSRVDSYTVRVTGNDAYAFQLDGSEGFSPHLVLRRLDGTVVAEYAGYESAAQFKVIPAPGVYELEVTSASRQLGPYTLSSALISPSETQCQTMFVTPGVTTEQTITKEDCQDRSFVWSDHFSIYLVKGTKATVTMSSNVLDTQLTIFDPTDRVIAADAENVSYTSLDTRLVITAGTSGYYRISAESQWGLGVYTLTIE